MTAKYVGEYLFGFFLVANKESIQTAKHLSLVLVPSKGGSLWELGWHRFMWMGKGIEESSKDTGSKI